MLSQTGLPWEFEMIFIIFFFTPLCFFFSTILLTWVKKINFGKANFSYRIVQQISNFCTVVVFEGKSLPVWPNAFPQYLKRDNATKWFILELRLYCWDYDNPNIWKLVWPSQLAILHSLPYRALLAALKLFSMSQDNRHLNKHRLQF